MTNPTSLPGRDADKLSPLDSLSRLELKTAALNFLEKAALKHREARVWRNIFAVLPEDTAGRLIHHMLAAIGRAKGEYRD